MKNKKGFTLIELIAVLAVLGFILMMAVPNIMNIFDNKKEELYNQTISELERFARNYLTEHPNLYTTIDEQGYVDILISDLCSGKYIACPVNDPRDNSEITGYIRISESNGDYLYSYNGTSSGSPGSGGETPGPGDGGETPIETYTITLNADGGNVGTNQIVVTPNETYTNLPTPTKTGYAFLGWYIGDTKIENGDTVTIIGDTTATARWQATTYIVTLEPDGGSVSSTQLYIAYGSEYGELPTPTKTGYTFDGWYIESTKILSTTVMNVEGGTTLTARYNANTYTINYDLDGGTKGTKAPTTGTFDTIIEIDNPTKANYDFVGWTITSGLNTETAKYGANDTTVSSSIDSSSTKILYKYFKNLTDSGSVTLTANYTASEYTLRLNANGGSVTPAEMNVTYNESYTNLPTPTRDGYTFKGWFIGNLEIKNGDTIALTGNAEAVASWQINSYSITYNGNSVNGLTVSDIPGVQKKTHGESLTLSSISPVSSSMINDTYTVTINTNGGSGTNSLLTANNTTSYIFTGWNTESDGSGTTYAVGDNYVLNQDVTLYAQWEAGTTSTESVVLPSSAGTKDNYKFCGWNTNSSGTGTNYEANSSFTPSEDVTLYAYWGIQYIYQSGTIKGISGFTRTNSSQSNSSGVLTFKASSRDSYSLIRTTDMINLTNAKRLVIKFASGSKTYRYSSGSWYGFGVTTATPTIGTDGGTQYKISNRKAWHTFAHTENNNAQPSGELSVDISGIDGNGYIVILFDSMSDYFNGVLKITEIRIEY